MIALDFDDAFAHGTARSAAFFEFGRQRFDIRDRQRQTADRRDPLARPALDLARHAHGRRFSRTRNSLGAHAVANRPATVGAQAADTGRVNDARIHGLSYSTRRKSILVAGGAYARSQL